MIICLRSTFLNENLKKASLCISRDDDIHIAISNSCISPIFICVWINGWHPPVKIRTPLQGGAKTSQGGAKKIRLASLAISHPPDPNSETAPGKNNSLKI